MHRTVRGAKERRRVHLPTDHGGAHSRSFTTQQHDSTSRNRQRSQQGHKGRESGETCHP
ncbi:hypothetical protein C8Q76DRAFT_732956 [Earliella scabrosa]|nr:hypothetical protein C8Q76DRAFT_732956 [Earliella scabrosa]